MRAGERWINQVLTEEIRYEIPPYQRPYSWEKEDIEQLVEDIWEAFCAGEREYFIGSLIVIEKEENRLYEVVDGQQRLTALNLLFARMQDAVDEPAKTALRKRILPENELTREKGEPRLNLRKKDREFFYDYVLSGQEIDQTRRRSLEKNKDITKLRIIEGLESIDEFFEKRDVNEEKIRHFADYILGNVCLVFVRTSSLSSAHRLFNVLNARGVPLSNADLIKNMLFSQLGNTDTQSEENLNEKWLQFEEIIGIKRLDLFFSHHRSSIVARRVKKALHEEYEPLVRAKNSPFAFLEEITSSTENYQRIQDHEQGFDDAAALRSLRSLHRVKFEEWIPPLLAFLNKPVDGLSEAEFVDFLEKITYQNWIRRLGLTARQTVYFQLISAIREGKSAQDIRKIFHDNASNEEFRNLLGGDIYGKQFDRAILLRIEEADQDESVTKNYSGRITIEHVLPQSLRDEYWRQRFTDEEHEKWLHRLGNLVLLGGSKNSKARYFDFERKKKIYEERGKKISFDTTKEILSKEEWTVEQIHDRQKEMSDRAVGIWAIK